MLTFNSNKFGGRKPAEQPCAIRKTERFSQDSVGAATGLTKYGLFFSKSRVAATPYPLTMIARNRLFVSVYPGSR
jgi:hypothetical protein